MPLRRALITTLVAVLILILLASRIGTHAQAPGGAAVISDRSVWDGVYTNAQATRGEAAYQAECFRCHPAGPMTGTNFMSIWNGRTASDLFLMIKSTMPQDGPGKFERRVYVDVVAYTFKANGFPAGQTELKNEADSLKHVRIEPKPQGQ
jgi:hypothetical protein